MLSILYTDKREIPHADEKLTADLLLGTSFSYICQDISKRQIFLSVLTNPLVTPDEISFRCEILRDFTASPNLCGGFRHELDELLKLRDSAQKERSHAYTTSRSVDTDAAFESARIITQLYAHTAEKAVGLLSQISLVLGMYNARSAGLAAIKRRADDFKNGADDFYEICRSLYEYSDETDEAVLSLYIGDNGRIELCELTGIENRSDDIEKPSVSKLKKLFAKTPPTQNAGCADLPNPFGKHRNSLFTSAFSRISELLDRLTRDIFNEFCPLARELAFYETAVAYILHMKQRNVPLCTPTAADLSASASTEIHGLYDLLLAAEYPDAAGIVPNDALLDRRGGVIITGDNNSGKTVYLRSVGCAQLLFQAGLPIPASSAVIQVRSAVYTRYAAAEKEFCQGNDAGRFEQEVREIAPLIDSIKPDSLLLLNEIFQTTSYSEGADGLFNILRYLNRRGASFILVTHLRDLLDKFDGGIVHMRTKDGYRLECANI